MQAHQLSTPFGFWNNVFIVCGILQVALCCFLFVFSHSLDFLGYSEYVISNCLAGHSGRWSQQLQDLSLVDEDAFEPPLLIAYYKCNWSIYQLPGLCPLLRHLSHAEDHKQKINWIPVPTSFCRGTTADVQLLTSPHQLCSDMHGTQFSKTLWTGAHTKASEDNLTQQNNCIWVPL